MSLCICRWCSTGTTRLDFWAGAAKKILRLQFSLLMQTWDQETVSCSCFPHCWRDIKLNVPKQLKTYDSANISNHKIKLSIRTSQERKRRSVRRRQKWTPTKKCESTHRFSDSKITWIPNFDPDWCRASVRFNCSHRGWGERRCVNFWRLLATYFVPNCISVKPPETSPALVSGANAWSKPDFCHIFRTISLL